MSHASTYSPSSVSETVWENADITLGNKKRASLEIKSIRAGRTEVRQDEMKGVISKLFVCVNDFYTRDFPSVASVLGTVWQPSLYPWS